MGGLGETFAPDLSTGTGTFGIALDLPHGPNDIGPKLTLRYDTGSPNGAFGLGWALPLPRLLRSTSFGRPTFDERDTIVLEGSGPLVADGAVLRPQVDTGDWRIEPASAADPPGSYASGFLVTDRAGTRYLLGTTADSRLDGSTGVPWMWLLRRVEDNVGGVVDFAWTADAAQRYLQTIAYGAYEVRLAYEPRPDVLRSAASGGLLVTDRRCNAIELHVPGAGAGSNTQLHVPDAGAGAGTRVRRWALGYEQSEPSGQSLLSSVTLTGVGADGAELAAPALRLGYARPAAPRLVRVPSIDPAAAPPGLDGRDRVELVDWDGDGLPDVLQIGDGGSSRVWLNRGGAWDRPRQAGPVPQLAAAGARAALADLNGDGLADVVRIDVPAGGYQPRTEAGFGRPVRWSRAPAVALGSPSARLCDFDGDGVPDALWSVGAALLLAHRTLPDPEAAAAGDGWSAVPLVVERTLAGVPTDLADPHVFAADMTGDGSTDLVRVDGGGVRYWPYLGDGRFDAPVAMGSPPELPFDVDPTRLFVVDIDGDGCADVVLADDGRVRWWPNRTGSAFGPVREVPHVPTGAMREMRIADVLGTGTPALCWSMTIAGRTAWYALDLLGGTRPGVLSEIDNGIGLRTAISYTTSALEAQRDRADGHAWPSRLPLVLPVVSETVATDSVGPGSTATTRYRYHDGRYDPVLREFCGFARVEQHDLGDEHTPGLQTVRAFDVGSAGDVPAFSTLADRRRARATRGRLLSVERSDEAGNVFDRIEYEWEVADTERPDVLRPRQRRMTTSVIEGGAAPASWIVTENLAWDENGNLTQSEERSYESDSGPAAPTAVLRTSVEFALDASGRYRQRVARILQTDGQGEVLADTRTEYDGAPAGSVGAEGLVTARSALALPDALVAEVYGAEPPDLAALGYRRGDGGWWIDLARYERTDDAGGLRGQVTGPRGASTQIAFDASRSFPDSVTDAGGNTTTAVNDVRLCRVTALTDASGATTTATYDQLARVTGLVRPGDSAAGAGAGAGAGVGYAYNTDALPVRMTTTDSAGGAAEPLVAHELYDGTGRLIQRQVLDDGGVVAEASSAFGARGLPVRVWTPCRVEGVAGAYLPPPAGAASIELFHDALGRPVGTVRSDGARRTVRHLPGAIEEADEEDLREDPGATHAGTVTRQILDAAGRARAVEQRLGARVLRSTYTFDVKGRLREQTDATGATTEFTHDLLGRLLRVRRPEATTVTVLDASGNLAETRSGSARVYRSFDLLDRPLEVRRDSADGAPAVRCTYHDTGAPAPPDAGAHTGGGRLVRVDHDGGSYVYDYDEGGRVAKKTMTVEGQVLAIDLAHRPDGLLDRIAYPDAARTSVAYRYDRRGRLASIDGVIDAIAYDEAGRRLQTRYSNGVVQENGYDDATGWLSSFHLAGAGGAVLRDLAYQHDLTGNLVAIESPDANHAWTYAYDDLYRLVGARNGTDALAYSYDDAGNILDASGRGAYRYGEASAASTLLTSIAGTGAPETFAWDDRGHLRTAPWGAHTVDAEGRLRRIDLLGGGAEVYDYDHTGALVRRLTTGADGSALVRLTPDPLVEVSSGELVLRVTDGTRAVARIAADGAREWLHVDHLGSLVSITDETGAAVADVRYGPYGEVAAHTGAPSQELGFGTGRPAAPNLVLLGERWYCPEIGRFLSPDPLVAAVYEPLSWNAYAYCLCNPTSIVDPTGRAFWKVFAAVLATVAIVALVVVVSVFTFGIASPAAFAIGTVTWSTVFAATIAAVVVGGVVGGIAAARAGGDAGDIVLGALVGAAVGGWAAFGAAFAGPAVAGVFGLHAGMAAGAVAGAVSGAINGAAVGFAAGFAGGRNNGLGDIMTKVLVGALIGAAVGAALGAASGMTPPKNPDGTATTPWQAAQKSFTPDPPAQGPASLAAPPASGAPPTEGATLLGAGTQMLEVGAFPQAHIFLSQIAGFTGSATTQTVSVDLLAGTGSLLFTDVQRYLLTHRVDLGPFNFVKGSWSGYP